MLNPNALLVIALATVVGLLLGSWPLGLLVGLLIVLAATVSGGVR